MLIILGYYIIRYYTKGKAMLSQSHCSGSSLCPRKSENKAAAVGSHKQREAKYCIFADFSLATGLTCTFNVKLENLKSFEFFEYQNIKFFNTENLVDHLIISFSGSKLR